MHTLFICGAPHNSKGFEFTVIDGSSLPDNIGQYIDIYDADKMKDGRNYVIQKLSISKIEYTLVGVYVRINPSDQKTSRGSYIAVGVLTDESISLHSAIDYFCTISSLEASLKMLRNERNAFSTNFSLKNDASKIVNNYNYIPFLANLTKNLSKDENKRKVIFNDLLHEKNIRQISDISLDVEFKELKLEIEKYIEEIKEEKEAHYFTRRDYDRETSQLKEENEQLKYANEIVNDRISEKNRKIESLEKLTQSLDREVSSLRMRGNIVQSNQTMNTSSAVNPGHQVDAERQRLNKHQYKDHTTKRNNKKSKTGLKALIAVVVLSSIGGAIYFFFDLSSMHSDKIPDVENKKTHVSTVSKSVSIENNETQDDNNETQEDNKTISPEDNNVIPKEESIAEKRKKALKNTVK